MKYTILLAVLLFTAKAKGQTLLQDSSMATNQYANIALTDTADGRFNFPCKIHASIQNYLNGSSQGATISVIIATIAPVNPAIIFNSSMPIMGDPYDAYMDGGGVMYIYTYLQDSLKPKGKYITYK